MVLSLVNIKNPEKFIIDYKNKRDKFEKTINPNEGKIYIGKWLDKSPKNTEIIIYGDDNNNKIILEDRGDWKLTISGDIIYSEYYIKVNHNKDFDLTIMNNKLLFECIGDSFNDGIYNVTVELKNVMN
jgi:hypothetical protein